MTLLTKYRKLRRRMSATPVTLRHDDLFLVAYPKSGVTWFSFLIANLALQLSGDRRKSTFFNLQVFVPDIHVSNHLADPILSEPGFRIIKSHAVYNKHYKNIFYLVRDPRDVMVSYFSYLQTLGLYKGNIHDLVRDKNKGISAWVEHVESWVESTPPSSMLQFFRYEDLRHNVGSAMERIMSLWGYDVDKALIEDVVLKSSFNMMKADEQFYENGNHTIPSGHSFVRKGATLGNKVSELSHEDLHYIEEKAGEMMRLFKYE